MYTTVAGCFLALFIWIVTVRTEKAFGLLHQWALALTVIVGLVTSAHCHAHDLLYLTLAAILTLGPANKSEIKGVWFKAWFALMVVFPILTWIFCIPIFIETAKRLPNLAVLLCLLVCGGLHFRKLVQEAGADKAELKV